MKKLLCLALIMSLTGCETYQCAQKDFKTFVNDVSLNVGHPHDKKWKKGTSNTYKN
jgi:hypothetical protein